MNIFDPPTCCPDPSGMAGRPESVAQGHFDVQDDVQILQPLTRSDRLHSSCTSIFKMTDIMMAQRGRAKPRLYETLKH